ncbi:hypothetical protein LRQ04_07590 [Paenarthrobacter sp. AR 02]|uniref:hypothetical protein n=1 Tax=Paenarthrobacter sp. AR 02 TaxID=2899821 RepID=UPI001F3B46B2|nr:hypothetical protein [Paenarthrobacter sp. AR 02]MCF3139118.1 hypothetical protein [Paenarthrobacter sp. AR 02]
MKKVDVVEGADRQYEVAGVSQTEEDDIGQHREHDGLGQVALRVLGFFSEGRKGLEPE